jgi:ABC-type multidrug transport system fused ATPase/permease subunit
MDVQTTAPAEYTFTTMNFWRTITLVISSTLILTAFVIVLAASGLIDDKTGGGMALVVVIALAFIAIVVVLMNKFCMQKEILSFSEEGLSSKLYGTIPLSTIKSYRVDRFRGSRNIRIISSLKVIRYGFSSGNATEFEAVAARLEALADKYNATADTPDTSTSGSRAKIKDDDFFKKPYAMPVTVITTVVVCVVFIAAWINGNVPPALYTLPACTVALWLGVMRARK